MNKIHDSVKIPDVSLKIENKNSHLTTHFTNESQIIFLSKVALIGSVRYFLQLFYCSLKLIQLKIIIHISMLLIAFYVVRFNAEYMFLLRIF
jgi:hypothetical protein